MKKFVFSLFAMLVVTSLFLSCDQAVNMMTPAVKDNMNPMQPSVVSITHYSHRERRDYSKLTHTIGAGVPVYTVVTFSDNVPLVVADDESARPDIRAIVNGNETQFHIVPYGSSGKNFRSGDAKPIEDTRVFLCKYILPIISLEDGIGSFSVVTIADMIEPPLSLNILRWEAWDPHFYLHLAAKGLSRAGDRLSSPCEVGKSFPQLIEEEFEIAYNTDIQNQLYQIIREEKNIQPEERIEIGVTAREYLKLRLEFPEKNLDEIFELFRKSIQNIDADAHFFIYSPYVEEETPLPVDPEFSSISPENTPPEKAAVPLEPEEPVNLLAERVKLVFRRFLRPCDEDVGKSLPQLIEEEFEIAYNTDIQNHLYQIVREEKDLPFHGEAFGQRFTKVVNRERTVEEYLKLHLKFPEKNLDEIFELFHEAVRNSNPGAFITSISADPIPTAFQ